MSGARRLLAIVNPAAGGGRCARRAPAALEALRDGGFEVAVRETAAPGDAVAIARAARAEGWPLVVAVGGDGTANEVLNGLLPSPGEHGELPYLGLLPLGTGNSFLRDFGTGDTAWALAALLAGRRRRCDVLALEHDGGRRLLLNVLGFGFPAEVGALVERRLKPLGAAGYTVGVLALLAGLRYLDLPHRLDGGAWHRDETTFLCICNSRFTGGTMEMAPSARVDDGELDLIRVDRASRLTLLRTFPKIFSGRHIDHPAVHPLRARRVDFLGDAPIAANLDGEVLVLVPRAVDVLPGAIDVAV